MAGSLTSDVFAFARRSIAAKKGAAHKTCSCTANTRWLGPTIIAIMGRSFMTGLWLSVSLDKSVGIYLALKTLEFTASLTNIVAVGAGAGHEVPMTRPGFLGSWRLFLIPLLLENELDGVFEVLLFFVWLCG